MKLKNNINEAIYTKQGVIALKSFYNYAEQKKYKPFGFPITVLYSSDGKKYAQVHAATKYDLIEITNINMDSFLDTYSNKMEFNQNPWSALKLEIYFNPEDLIFYFDNKRVKGYLDLVRTIKEINPELDIKPDPFWLKPVRFDVEAGGSFVKDFWFHISGNIDVDFITNRKNLFNEFRGVYVAEIPKDVMQCLYKKYKEPVIKNNGPLVKSKGNSRYIELGRRVNENKTNFFDHLDGGWGDMIADTYKKHTEELLLKLKLSDGDSYLVSKIFDFSNVKEGDEISFIITNSNIETVKEERIESPNDDSIYYNIPVDKIIVLNNDVPVPLLNNDKQYLDFYKFEIVKNQEGIVKYLNVYDIYIKSKETNISSPLYYNSVNYYGSAFENLITYINEKLLKIE